MIKTKNWIALSSIFLALGVAMGAFGAHGLKDSLDAYSLAVYEKAVFYHFIHALGILLVTILAGQSLIHGSALSKINYLLSFGIIIFSGSLYILAVTGVRWLGAITPIGGSAFILAWCLLTYEALKIRS